MSSYGRLTLQQAKEHAAAAAAQTEKVITLTRKLVVLTYAIAILTAAMLTGLGVQLWLALRGCAV
jgi:hypothetical protein